MKRAKPLQSVQSTAKERTLAITRSNIRATREKITRTLAEMTTLKKSEIEPLLWEWLQLVCLTGDGDGKDDDKPKQEDDKPGEGEDKKAEKKAKKPDYSKAGETGKRSKKWDKAYNWRDEKKPQVWDLIAPNPKVTCDDFIIEVWYGENSGQCPPAAGFAALVKAATDKAKEEAEKIPCFDCCPDKSVEIIWTQWDCLPNGKAIALAQAVRHCMINE